MIKEINLLQNDRNDIVSNINRLKVSLSEGDISSSDDIMRTELADKEIDLKVIDNQILKKQQLIEASFRKLSIKGELYFYLAGLELEDNDALKEYKNKLSVLLDSTNVPNEFLEIVASIDSFLTIKAQEWERMKSAKVETKITEEKPKKKTVKKKKMNGNGDKDDGGDD